MATLVASHRSAEGIRRARAPRDRTIWVPIAACAIVIALAIWTSAHKSLWVDEAYSLLTSDHSLAETGHRALRFELQPPVYFLLLNLWLRVGGASIEWARTFSTLCVLGSVIAIWVTTRSIWTGRGAPAPIIAALTATMVWAAAEARDYGLLIFLSALSYWLFLRIVTGRSRHVTRDAVCYGLVAYASLLTMYYSGFILLGQWVAAMTVPRARRVMTGTLAVVGVALLPWAGVILSQVGSHANPNASLPADIAQSHLPGGAAAVLLRDVLGALFAAAPVLSHPYVALLFAAGLAIVPVLCLMGSRGDLPSDTLAVDERLLAIALVVSTGALVTLRVTNLALVWPRHMAGLVPGFLLLWSIWIARAPTAARAWLASAVLGAVCLVTLASYERGADVADARGAASYVIHRGPADPVIVIGPEAVLAFRYYYRGQDHGTAPVFGVPVDPSLEIYNPDPTPLVNAAQIDARMAAAGVRHAFWLVVSKQYVWKSTAAMAAVQTFVRAHAAQHDSADFKNFYVMKGRD